MQTLESQSDTFISDVRSTAPDRRLLAIYDLATQPISIGDILVIQEASLVLRERHRLGLVDFALVYDPKQPNQTDSAFASITEDNVLYNLASVLPVAQINQYLGCLFVFNSHVQLQQHIAASSGSYHIWPPPWKFAPGLRNREYLYYSVFNDLLHDYYQAHGTVPQLGCPPILANWAQRFYLENVYPQMLVTVQARNNKAHGAHRNLHIESWLEFFSYCDANYPVKFVILCAAAELDDRLRACPNVIIAKDYHTGIEQDLALIHAAAMHMGASSGPGVIANFNSKPYLFVNTDLNPNSYRGIIRENNYCRFCFAGPLQRFAMGQETTELLKTGFAEMWAAEG